jgi:peptide deformylase
MKKKYFLVFLPLLLIIVFSYQCKKDELNPPPAAPDTLALTQAEKDSIMTGDTNKVMRILLTTNLEDSLILRKESHQIYANPQDPYVYHLARRMYYTLKAASGGVGIAAPQVGINRDIIWVQRMDKTGKPFECFLNIKIVQYSTHAVTFNGDGCLSIPNVNGTSHRFSSVLIEYDKLDGTHMKEVVDGYAGSNFTAVCFQHEIDHLHGILFIDRL